MGLVIVGVLFIALGLLMMMYPDIVKRFGGSVLSIERAKNVEGDSAARVRQAVTLGLIAVGVVLVVIGLV